MTDQKVSREYVSTGHLPSPRQVQAAVDEAYRLYRAEASGTTSQTYPALARVPGHLFGICVAGVGGSMYRAGDSGHEFTIMSVAKPFVFALVCETLGAEQARQKLGVNATGRAFDSLSFVERSADGRSRPPWTRRTGCTGRRPAGRIRRRIRRWPGCPEASSASAWLASAAASTGPGTPGMSSRS